jgi:hypothetical protein
MNDKDLFGQTPKKVEGGFVFWKIRHSYGKSNGPSKCGNCRFHIIKKYQNNYHKCTQLGISASSASDIRVGNVCELWQQGNPAER